MPAEPVRHSAARELQPLVHDLPPLKYGGEFVAVRVVVRRTDEGTWRGRLVFGPEEIDSALSTAEILFGATDTDLWQCVRDLRDHHLRDLYRSLAE